MAYTKRNNNSKNREQRKQMVVKKYYLNAGNSTPSKEYDRDSLVKILDMIPFGRISIPVYLHRSFIEDDGKGYLNIGYVKSYYPTDEEFEVIVKDNFVAAVESFSEAVIYARVGVAKDGKVKNIIALDVVPVAEDEDTDFQAVEAE